MIELTRRSLIRSGISGMALSLIGVRGLAFTGDPRLLVVVHLRGGCDGLNLISPASDPDFVAARVSELRVADDGPDAGFSLANGADSKIDFRLHHAASGLAELYRDGKLTFLHAVGLTNETRSHFVAIDMIERGVADPVALTRIETGWLTRSLALGHDGPSIRAVSAAGALSGEYAGAVAALAIPDLNSGFAPAGGDEAQRILSALYLGDGPVVPAGRRALSAMADLDRLLPRDPAGKVVPYRPRAGVSYDKAGDFQRPFLAVAQLAKMNLGLSAATIDLGNWDTHEYQPGRFNSLVERFSAGLSGFYQDMAEMEDRLVIVVMSEFGRRLRSNRSAGTDHGRAGVMAILGGRVTGGRMAGTWPGLATEQLVEGVDLAVTTDYRQVLSEVLTWSGQNANVFPGFTPTAHLGLLRSSA